MSSVDAWLTLADTVAACPDEGARARLATALADLLALSPDRDEVVAGVSSRTDDAARLLQRASESPLVERGAKFDYGHAPDFSDADTRRARSAATSIAGGGEADTGDLAALSPDLAAPLVVDLVSGARYDVLSRAVETMPPHRFPVAMLLRTAAAMSAGIAAREALISAAARASDLQVVRGLAELLRQPGPPLAASATAVEELVQVRLRLATGPYQWWPGPHEEWSVPAQAGAEPEQAGAEPEQPVFRGPDAATREAFPRIDVESGTDRPDVVVVDQPFEVTVGLQARKDRALVSASPVTFVAGETVTLELVLLFDPDSISVSGQARAQLLVSDGDPYPAATFTCTALYDDELDPQRRLGMQLLRDGQVVSVAWRTLVAVDDVDDVAGAPTPPRREMTLLDLDPLVGDEPPDLVVSVCRADAGSATFVWTAYAADPAVSVPDLPSSCTLDSDVAAFALEARRGVQFSTDAAKDYLDIAGRAHRIGRAVPEGIQEAIRELVEKPGRAAAPSMLLLTEEVSVPWELAAFDPPFTDGWGGESPFLGAHVAVSRWPLTEHKPKPRPRNTILVREGAVLTADYEGVPGWGRLDSAMAEAQEIAALFDPPAAQVAPELWAVTDLFRGRPAGDVLHVALHGQYDGAGDQEGLVLLAKSPAGGATAQFLSAVDLENGDLDRGPFVFLNACQVGTDERVLGDYGGFASTLLRIGATAVVAPLWNVRDDVAAEFARRFYATTLTADTPVSVAESVRALRATYTEAEVRAGTPGLHATLVAYQVFGHPCLRLAREPRPTP